MKVKHTEGRVIVSVDIENKNWTNITGEGNKEIKIRLERQWNQLNRRISEPVNAFVISSDFMPIGAEVLIHHNSLHDVNRLFNFNKLSGQSEASDIKYYSLPETECFIYREKDSPKWKPCKNFETALRVFKPYDGILLGIEPKEIKNKLYITSGEYKGQVACVLKGCDYQIVYQGVSGREENIIRLRHFQESNPREEIVAIDHDMTEQVNNGNLLIGITVSDAKKLERIKYENEVSKQYDELANQSKILI